MGQGYFRNIDDSYSDPTLVASQYQIGRNAYFEVSLTLAEYADSLDSLRGGVVGSPDLAQSLAGAYGGIGIGCPEVSQYVWVDGHKTIRAKKLIGQEGRVRLYNPITRNFNVLKSAKIVQQPLCEITTQRGVASIVSASHQIIRYATDRVGISLARCVTGQAVLSFDEGLVEKVKNWNIYNDTVMWYKDVGMGDVVQIELEDEWIYATGSTRKQGIVSHNRKDENGELV